MRAKVSKSCKKTGSLCSSKLNIPPCFFCQTSIISICEIKPQQFPEQYHVPGDHRIGEQRTQPALTRRTCLEREERSLAQSFDLQSLKFQAAQRWQVRQNCYNTATNHQLASHWTRAGAVTNGERAQVGGQPIGGLQIFGYSFWLLSRQPGGGRPDRARLVTLRVLV